jgi:branched-chain amino acid transport system substrate-binding protein
VPSSTSLPRAIATIAALAGLGVAAGSAPAAAASTYDIGLIATLSGQVAFIGEAARKSIQLRVDQINAAGGINGHKLNLLVEDDKCDPTAAVSIAQRFVNDDAMAGVLGPFCSAASVAVKSVFARAKMVDLTIASTADAITQGTQWSFQIAAPDSVYATALANYAADHGHAVAVLNDTSAFGLGAYTTVAKVLGDRNVKPVDHEQITAGQPDISPQVLSMKSVNADFVIALVLGGDAAKLCLTARNLGLKAQLAGQTAWSFPNVLTLASGACDGALFTDPFDPSKPEAKAFLDHYEARWKERPQSYFAGAGWDAINLWAMAAAKAGSGDTLDQTKLLAALDSITGYRGAIGVGASTMNFSPGHHVALDAAATHLRQIHGDGFVDVPTAH